MEFLFLSNDEQLICWLLYKGKSRTEIGEVIHTTPKAIERRIQRAAKREHCLNALNLVCRFLDEYCGLMEPCEDYEAITEKELLRSGVSDGQCGQPDVNQRQSTRHRAAAA